MGVHVFVRGTEHSEGFRLRLIDATGGAVIGAFDVFDITIVDNDPL